MKKFYFLLICFFCLTNNFRSYGQTGSSAVGVTVAGGKGAGTALNQVTPQDVALDPSGNIYVLDQQNNRVLRFPPGSMFGAPDAPEGVVVAGGNGRGSAANQLSSPYGIAVDASRNIYIADYSNNRIQKWTPGATQGVIVGNNFGGQYQTSSPRSVCVDAAGNVYAMDYYNQLVRKYEPGASDWVTVLRFNEPEEGSAFPTNFAEDVFVDRSGNIYLVQNFSCRVRKFASGSSTGTTVAGGYGSGSAANQLMNPRGGFIDDEGNIFVADYANDRIQKWVPGATAGITVAGGNGRGDATNQLYRPYAVAGASGGRIYVADIGNNRVQRFTLLGAPGSPVVGTTIAGGGGLTTSGVHVDASGNVYVADAGNNRIQKFAPGSLIGVTVAGGNGAGSGSDQLNNPKAVALDATGNIYVADANNNRVQKWAPGASLGITVAGGNGPETATNQLGDPNDLFVDKTGNLYVCENDNDRITKWAPGASAGIQVARSNNSYYPTGMFVDDSGFIYVSIPELGIVEKWGAGSFIGVVAGKYSLASSARELFAPAGIFVDSAGNIYIADQGNHRIQKWAPGATEGITVAGGNGAGSASTQLSYPNDVFVDKSGNIYVADQTNGRIQKFGAKGAGGGINFKYIEGLWNTLPDFNTWEPVKSGVSANIDVLVKPAGRNDYYAFLWEGKIKIPTAGVYTFETVSDDGSRLYFNSRYSPLATPTVNNDGIHAASSATGVVNVAASGTYPIAISYFEKDGGETMQVFWTGPGIPRQLISDSVLVLESGDNIAPSIPENLHLVSKGSNFVNLDWDNAIDDVGVTKYEVYVNGYLKYTSVASQIKADGLAPNSTYRFSLKAYDLEGNTSGFSQEYVASTGIPINGLNYKYYEGTWNTLPDFTTLTPVKTGNSPNVDISLRPAERGDNFAFLWEGYINIPKPGTYTFETVSDDGSKLYFNSIYVPSAFATLNNDGVHAATSVTSNVFIGIAGSYPISITFFEKDGGENMQVYWKGPGMERQLIPDAAFTPATPSQLSGLSYKYYEGNWNTLPDFTALTPVGAGRTPNVNINVRPAGKNDNFAFLWEGNIIIPAPGNYTFETVSDDGSRLYFNAPYNASAAPLVNNDGLHAPASATGSVYIAAAGSYPISITFFEKDNGEHMQVYWTGPGITRQLIPDEAFGPELFQSSGLNYKYYEGTWDALPDFNALSPVKSGNTPNFNIDVRPIDRNDNFGFLWEGKINIPSEGQYTFETVSDDGSKLYFNQLYSSSATPLVNNDGLHPAGNSVTGTVYIPAAGSYPLAVTYFEKNGNETMQVYWSGPGFTRQLIPAAAFIQPIQSSVAVSNVSGEKLLSLVAGEDANEGKTKIRKAYPDPFIDGFKIDFYNSSPANDITVSVYDLNGRSVYNHHAGKFAAGNNSMTVLLNGTRLTNGIYLVTLHVNGLRTKTIRLLKTNR